MPSTLADKLILIVEDEECLLRGMQVWLRDSAAGYAVMNAADGTRALELIERYKPDLVISDVRLPGASGLEILLACRRKFPSVRFILTSAYGTKELEEESLKYGALRFLSKPVDMFQLEKTILQVMSTDAPIDKSGFLDGISVPGFAQLVSTERQTMILNLTSNDGRSGSLHFNQGELVHASLDKLSSEEAAIELLGWEEAQMHIIREPEQPSRTIKKSLTYLVMESMRVKDEARRG
ncbi:MAG: response regulator [Deltaproteobacteria bacterium]|nr:response regulator [Deltaproteobacteria bacterium]MBW1870951.1 response regulator [Deltaproteobacteria bacterium]